MWPGTVTAGLLCGKREIGKAEANSGDRDVLVYNPGKVPVLCISSWLAFGCPEAAGLEKTRGSKVWKEFRPFGYGCINNQSRIFHLERYQLHSQQLQARRLSVFIGNM